MSTAEGQAVMTNNRQGGQSSMAAASNATLQNDSAEPDATGRPGGCRPRVVFSPRGPSGGSGPGGGGRRNNNRNGRSDDGQPRPPAQRSQDKPAQPQEDGGGRRPTDFRGGGGAKNARIPNNQYGNGVAASNHNNGQNNYNNRRPTAGQRFPATAKNRRDHAGMPMVGPASDCLICCQRSDLFAIGDCLHPMCMECGIRTRVIGKSPLCPHCRTDVGTLYFVEWRQNGELAMPLSSVVCEEAAEFAVQFESAYALNAFRSYLSHKCRLCCSRENAPDAFSFPNFAALQQHLTQCHKMTFCYLCSENLNTLTKDRWIYNREQLQRHMNGEERVRGNGFRGHPKCLFCEQRFYDEEQQYRHLRRDHFFCQICDSDGADNFFYRTHNELTGHYKRAHHPCTHADCVPLGIVFRSDVELNVHRAKQHTVGGGRKHCAIDFNYSGGGASSSTAAAASGGNSEPPPLAPIVAIVPSAQSGQQPARIVPSASFNAADFPLLNQFQQLQPPYGAPPNWRHLEQMKAINSAGSAPQLPLQSGEQFPGLPGAPLSSTARPAGQSAVTAPTTVWAKAATRQLFKPSTASSAGTSGQPAAAKTPVEPRKKVIPLPDVFPEGMREVLRARQAGLPDPPPAPVELSQADRYVEVKRQEKAQKKKEKKAKRMPASVAAQMAASSADGTTPVSSSRFGMLQADSSDDEVNRDEFGRIKNWWSSSTRPPAAPILHESNGDFVRIDVGTTVTHRRAPTNSAVAESAAGSRPAQISLSSIAANLCSATEDDDADGKVGDGGKTSAENCREKTQEDELELIRHQREAHYNNDYNLNNEDLDLQMALEMSLLSQLFLPPKTAASAQLTAPPGFDAQPKHSATGGRQTADNLMNPPGFSPKAVQKSDQNKKDKTPIHPSSVAENNGGEAAGGLSSGLFGGLKK